MGSFLGVFLNLHREKTVKYFSTSTIPHETKPMLCQAKKSELSNMSVAWVI